MQKVEIGMEDAIMYKIMVGKCYGKRSFWIQNEDSKINKRL
jgi:hypothetical protein